MNNIFIADKTVYVEHNTTETVNTKPLFNMNDVQFYIIKNIPDAPYNQELITITALDEPQFGTISIDNFIVTYTASTNTDHVEDTILLQLNYDSINLKTFKINVIYKLYANIFNTEITINTIENVTRTIQLPNTNNEYNYLYRIIDTATKKTTYNSIYYNILIQSNDTSNNTIIKVEPYLSCSDTITIHAYRSLNDTFNTSKLDDYKYDIIKITISVKDPFTFEKHTYDNYITRNKYRASNQYLHTAYTNFKQVLHQRYINGMISQTTNNDFSEIFNFIQRSIESYKFNQENKLLMQYIYQFQ